RRGRKKTRVNQERLDSKVKRVQNTNEDPSILQHNSIIFNRPVRLLLCRRYLC
ncbi:hypothetical protein L9F63_007104, partial [Diploptera punctata]